MWWIWAIPTACVCGWEFTSSPADSTKILDDFEWPAYDVPQVTNQNPLIQIISVLPFLGSHPWRESAPFPIRNMSSIPWILWVQHPHSGHSMLFPVVHASMHLPTPRTHSWGVRLWSPSAAQVSWPVSRPEVTPGWSKDLTFNQMTRKYRRWVASSRLKSN